MSEKGPNILLPAIAFIVVICGVLFAWKSGFIMPNIAENQAKIKAFDQDIASAQAKLDSLAGAETTMTKLSDIVNNLLISVPDTVNAPDLITEVAAIASANQVAITSLTPPTVQTNQTGSANIASASTSSLAVTMSVNGSFSGVNNFISGIESDIRYSRMTSLNMTASQEGVISASLSFDVYKRPAVSASSGGAK